MVISWFIRKYLQMNFTGAAGCPTYSSAPKKSAGHQASHRGHRPKPTRSVLSPAYPNIAFEYIAVVTGGTLW